MCLSGVLDTFYKSDCVAHWSICLDASVSVTFGVPIVGNHRVSVPVRGTHVDFTAVLASDRVVVAQSIGSLGPYPDPRRVSMYQLCLDLEGAGRKCQWLWKQVIHNIACWIDCEVMEEVASMPETHATNAEQGDAQQEEVLSAERLIEGRQAQEARRRLSKATEKYRVKPLIAPVQERRVVQYFLASRACFADAKTLHVAFDAGRVGGLNRMLGFVTTPNGIGAWVAPQAIGGNV